MNNLKSFDDFLMEAAVADNFTYEQINNDIEAVKDAENKAKKVAIASKYGIQSAKIGEIVSQLYMIGNNKHKSKNPSQYDDEDFMMWWRCFDGPVSTVALRKALANEKIEWIEFVKNKAEELIFSQWTKGRYHYKMEESFRKAIRNFINADKNAKDTDRINLIATLKEKTKDFHDEYINVVRQWSDKRFNDLEQLKDFEWGDFMSLFGTINRDVVVKRENCLIRNVGVPDSVYYACFSYKSKEYTCPVNRLTLFNEKYEAKQVRVATKESYSLRDKNPETYADIPNKNAVRYYNYMTELKFKYKWNKDRYIEDQVTRAENKYNADIEVISDRVRKMKLDEDSIDVLSIESDPKHYDITLTDGNRTVHARSIFAAQFSFLVSPHYRFIIT